MTIDCTTCKHGSFNDHFDIPLCNVEEACWKWDKWEPKEECNMATSNNVFQNEASNPYSKFTGDTYSYTYSPGPQFCCYRLPCGICEKLQMQCLKMPSQTEVTFTAGSTINNCEVGK